MAKYVRISFILLFIISICILFEQSSLAQEKLYRVKAIKAGDSVYNAANIFWDENGVYHSMFGEANNRTIVLSFWGTWCPFCMRHLPDLAQLYDSLPKDKYYFITAVSENSNNNENLIRAALNESGVHFDNAWYCFCDSENLQVHLYYNITKFIMTVIISPEKVILDTLPDITFNSMMEYLNRTGYNEEQSYKPDNVYVYVNPFSNSTIIKFKLAKDSHVILKVYNIFGKEVSTLVNGSEPAGEKRIEFNTDGMPDGIYFYRLQVGKQINCGKMLVAR